MGPNRVGKSVFASGAAFAALLSVQAPAQAANTCVNVNGDNGCFAVIQDAIDAAGPGDMVLIHQGVYFQTFAVPAGKDGLTVRGAGSGRVVRDPGPPQNTGTGITVSASDVTLTTFAVRNGDSRGIVIEAGATGTLIERQMVGGADSDCIDIDGAEATVRQVELIGCGDNAIDADADDVAVLNNKIRSCDNGCIEISGDRAVVRDNSISVSEDTGGCVRVIGDFAVVERNHISVCDRDGIRIEGDNATVSANTVNRLEDEGIDIRGDGAAVTRNAVTGADNSGIEIVGDNPAVTSNVVTHVGDRGIDIMGENPVVVGNRVSGSGDEGVLLDCMPCTGGEVSANNVSDVSNDHEAFDIFAQAPGGLLVEGNLARRADEHGFDITGFAIILRHNKAEKNGGDKNNHGFNIRGDGHTVDGNESRGNHGDGFGIRGVNHMIIANKAVENRQDGFDFSGVEFSGVGFVLTDNVALDNFITGFQASNFSGPATLSGNQADGNRQAFCDPDATAIDGGGNNFVIGGVIACDPD